MTPAHLTRRELEQWHHGGDPAERARVVSHLAVCDECGALYGDVFEALEPVETPTGARPNAASLAARAYAAYRPGRPAWTRHLARPRTLVTAAAAAILVAAVLVPGWLTSSPGPSVDAGIRGSDIQLLAPIGPVDNTASFRWASPIAAVRYRVEVTDAEGRVVGRLEVATQQAAFADVVPTALPSGAEYRWRVVALDERGRPLTTSPERTFVVQ